MFLLHPDDNICLTCNKPARKRSRLLCKDMIFIAARLFSTLSWYLLKICMQNSPITSHVWTLVQLDNVATPSWQLLFAWTFNFTCGQQTVQASSDPRTCCTKAILQLLGVAIMNYCWSHCWQDRIQSLPWNKNVRLTWKQVTASCINVQRLLTFLYIWSKSSSAEIPHQLVLCVVQM